MSAIEYQTYCKTYKEVALLGNGNYSEVYQIIHKKTSIHYALKFSSFVDSEELSSAFQEIQIMKVLAHPSIVKIYYYFIHKTQTSIDLGIIMEKGQYSLEYSIRERAKKKQYFSYEEVRQCLSRMVNSLSYLQEHNYLHRDIKPENILLFDGQQGGWKLCDFGLAIREHEFSDETIAGTYRYSSPKLKLKFKNKEQKITGNTIKDDVYSLGITMMEVCLLAANTTFRNGIRQITTLYGQELGNIIQAMLRSSEEERIDFLGIKTKFPNIQKPKPTKLLPKSQSSNHTLTKKKFTSHIQCLQIIEVDDDCLLIVASGKTISFIRGKIVATVVVPELCGEITCFCYDGKLLWFGSTDTYLRSASLSNIVLQVEQGSLSAKKLELKKYTKSYPISCICLGDQNEVTVGHYNGYITAEQLYKKPKQVHTSSITSLLYDRKSLYSCSLDGYITKQQRQKKIAFDCNSGIIECCRRDDDLALVTMDGFYYVLNMNLRVMLKVRITFSCPLAMAINDKNTFVADGDGKVHQVEGELMTDVVETRISCLKTYKNTLYAGTFNGQMVMI